MKIKLEQGDTVTIPENCTAKIENSNDRPLMFNTQQDAQAFITRFKNELETAKPLL